jgi:hypothetical protein
MKKNNKKWLVVAGALALCAVLIAVIANQFKAPAVVDESMPVSGPQSTSVVVEPVVKPVADTSTADAGGAVDSGPEQTIQGDVSRPEAPPAPEIDEDALTDPDNVPTYTPEQTNPSQGDAPTGGDTRPGQIYIPGFGWVADEGGGGAGTDTGSGGDPNKQVGDM